MEECEKRGRPGLIHHVSDVRWMRGGHENDVRGKRPTSNIIWVALTHSGVLEQSVVRSFEYVYAQSLYRLNLPIGR